MFKLKSKYTQTYLWHHHQRKTPATKLTLCKYNASNIREATGNSTVLTVLPMFPAGTSSRMDIVIRSVTILGISLTVLNALRSHRQLANMKSTMQLIMVMEFMTKVATLRPVAGMAWTVLVILCQNCWMAY